MKLDIAATDLVAIQEHAKAEFPKEACGALTPGGYRPMVNRSRTPDRSFDCAEECRELQLSGQLLAVVHSHPNGPMGPSSWDMRQQIAMGVPWGLVITDGQRVSRPFFWGDALDPPALEGRPFRHGPSGTDGKGDCYALIRDWYRVEKGILLPEFPRDDAWWSGTSGGDNLYRDGFAKAGFVDVGRTEGLRAPQIGDVFLVHIRSPHTPNHGGVYVDDGIILHHMGECLSVKKPVGAWIKQISHWLRREA